MKAAKGKGSSSVTTITNSRSKTRRAGGRVIEALESRLLLAVVTWDGGGDGINWTNPLNWSGNVLPGAADDVSIAAGAQTIQISSGTHPIRSLVSDRNLNVTGGTLAPAAASQINATLNLSNGSIGGAGEFKINNAMIWSGGWMDGAGSTVIAATATLSLTAGGNRTLSRVLENNGTATWTGGSFGMAGGTLNNKASFTIHNGSSNLDAPGNTALSAFNNLATGTIFHYGTATTSIRANSAALTFNNSGNVYVAGGTLALDGGGTHSNTFYMDVQGRLSLSGSHTFDTNAHITGEGRLGVTNGTITSNGNVHVDGGTIFSGGTSTFNGQVRLSRVDLAATVNFNAAATLGTGTLVTNGVLGGSGEVTFIGPLTWTGGSMTATGTGKTIIASDTSLSLEGSGNRTLSRVLENKGTATWTTGNLTMAGGRLDNSGSFTVNSSSNLEFSGNPASAFNNLVTGFFTKLGTGTVSIRPNTAFNNDGRVSIQAGTLALAGGGSHTRNFTIDLQGLLSLEGSHTFSLNSQISGDGNLTIANGITTSDGTVIIDGTARFLLGTATFNGEFFGGNLNLLSTANFNAAATFNTGTIGTGGILGGSGETTFNTSLAWTGGTMRGTGKTIMPSFSTLNISGDGASNRKFLQRTLLINRSASTTWTGTGALVFDGGTLNHAGSMTVNSSAGNVVAQGDNNNGIFNNDGTVTKIGAGTASINFNSAAVAFNNTGTVDVQAGTLGLNSGGSHSGIFTLAASTLLNFNRVHSSSISSSITGGGNFTVDGGSTSYEGNVNIGGTASFTLGTATFSGAGFQASNITLNSGSAIFNTGNPAVFANGTLSNGILGGSADVEFTGQVTWAAGTMSGAGETIIKPGANFSIESGVLPHTLNRRLRNDGTAIWTGGNISFDYGSIENNHQFEMRSATLLDAYGNGGEANLFENKGTLIKNGTGIAQFRLNTSGVTFSNTGTLIVGAGTLSLLHAVAQLSDSTLFDGVWHVGDGSGAAATLNFPFQRIVEHIYEDAHVGLWGNSSFPALDPLSGNGGRLEIRGRDFNVSPRSGSFSNSGVIELSAGDTLDINGGYHDGFFFFVAGKLRLDVSGTTPNQTLSQVSATGNLRLYGYLEVQLTGGFDPGISTSFRVINGSSREGTFYDFLSSPTPSGRRLNLNYDATGAFVTVAPLTPGAPNLIAASDSGQSSTDNLTNDATPTFTGTADDGSTVLLYADGNLVGSAVASGGQYSVTASALLDGQHTMTVRAQDSDGDVTDFTEPLVITIDTVAPGIPTTPDLQSSSDSGISETDNLTNDSTPTFRVLGLEMIQLLAGGTILADYRQPGAVTAPPLADGQFTISARAIDVAGNLSDATPGIAVTIDTVAPAPAVLDLLDTSDSGQSRTDNITNDTSPNFSVNAPELFNFLVNNSPLESYVSGTHYRMQVPHGTNSWSISAQSIDLAGNTSAVSETVQLTVDTAAPAAPTTPPDLQAASDSGYSNTDNITNVLIPHFTVDAPELVHMYNGDFLWASYQPASDAVVDVGANGPYGIRARSVDVAGNISEFSPYLFFTIDILPPRQVFAAPDLADASDSGFSNTDNITNDNTPALLWNDDVDSVDTRMITGTTLAQYVDGFMIFPTLTDGVHEIIAHSVDLAGNISLPSFPLTITIDTQAPRVLSSAFNFQTAQNVVFSFSEDPVTFAPADLQLQNLTTSTTIPATSIAMGFLANTATFTFPGFAHGVLPDGDYRASINQSGFADVAGNTLAAHAPIDFFTLLGDLNHDRQVSISDFIDLAANFNTTNAAWSDGDLNYDGQVTIADFINLSANFNKTLGPPPAPMPAPMPALSAVSVEAVEVDDADVLAPQRTKKIRQVNRHHRRPHTPATRAPKRKVGQASLLLSKRPR